jgi:hypothetical protein
MRYTLLSFLFLNTFVYGQNLHHQMLSSQGTSVELYNGIYIRQTIGQQSATGNSTKNGYTIGQGYQQSTWSKYINSNLTSNITTTTYPNPFIRSVNFQFSRPINEVISVAVFDIRGRLIFQEEKKASETILTIELEQLPAENYLVRLTAKNYTYYTQILKQQ